MPVPLEATCERLGIILENAFTQDLRLVLEVMAAMLDECDQHLAMFVIADPVGVLSNHVVEHGKVVVASQQLPEVMRLLGECTKDVRPERCEEFKLVAKVFDLLPP